MDYSKSTISQLATVIAMDWKSQGKIYFGAVPYIDAMYSMQSIKDNYGADPGSMIVAYFLANARQWKGETAKAVKAELNKRLKNKA